MKTQYNNTEHRREWIVSRWYEKYVFVTGVLINIFWVIAFVAGFVDALLN